jgi:hypothetical protein
LWADDDDWETSQKSEKDLLTPEGWQLGSYENPFFQNPLRGIESHFCLLEPETKGSLDEAVAVVAVYTADGGRIGGVV